MYQTVDSHDFCNAFDRMDRSTNFSWGARHAIFEYLEQLEEETDEQIELDVVAVCCEWAEYGVALEACEYYKIDLDLDLEYEYDDDEKEAIALEALENRSAVIPVSGGGIVIQQF